MNKVILMGNITQDLELKQTPNGHAVLNFSMATNSKVKRGDVWEDKAEFHNLLAWTKTAETIAKFCNKGSKILIEGQLETRNWEDKETGGKRYKTEIVVRSFEFAGGKTEKVASDMSKPAPQTNNLPNPSDNISVEDIPF